MKEIIKMVISLSAFIVCMFGLSISVNANYSNYNYTYTTTDDTVYYSNADPDSNGKILIFGRRYCGKTNHTLLSIAESDWIDTANVDIACINVDGADKATVLEHKEQLGLTNSDLITFCYGNSSHYGYTKHLAPSDPYKFLPLIVYIDKNDNIIAATSDAKTSDEVYYTMFGKYPETSKKSLENCTVEGVSKTFEYTGEPIQVLTSDFDVYSEKGIKLWRREKYDTIYYKPTSCGKYSVKIIGKEGYEYEGTSTEFVYYVVPKATKIKKITSQRDNYVTIKYNSSTGADGYQIVCSSNSKFPAKSTRKIKTESSDELTIKCDSGTYYIKIRPYIVEDGKRIFGKWSDVYEYAVGE